MGLRRHHRGQIVDLNKREREREFTKPVAITEVLVLSPEGVVNVGGPTHVWPNGPPRRSNIWKHHRHCYCQHHHHPRYYPQHLHCSVCMCVCITFTPSLAGASSVWPFGLGPSKDLSVSCPPHERLLQLDMLSRKWYNRSLSTSSTPADHLHNIILACTWFCAYIHTDIFSATT